MRWKRNGGNGVMTLTNARLGYCFLFSFLGLEKVGISEFWAFGI
jgi:hypothetical protein